MVNHFRFVVIICMMFSLASGQVGTKKSEMSQGKFDALVMTLVDVDKDLVEDTWKEYTANFGKTKKKKKEFITNDIKIDGLSNDNPVSLYLKLKKDRKNVSLLLWVKGVDGFLSASENKNDLKVMESFLADFQISLSKAILRDEFENASDKLKKLQKNLQKTIDSYSDNIKDIEKANKKIKKTEKENESLLKEQETLKTKITEQGMLVEELRNKVSLNK